MNKILTIILLGITTQLSGQIANYPILQFQVITVKETPEGLASYKHPIQNTYFHAIEIHKEGIYIIKDEVVWDIAFWSSVVKEYELDGSYTYKFNVNKTGTLSLFFKDNSENNNMCQLVSGMYTILNSDGNYAFLPIVLNEDSIINKTVLFKATY